MSPKADVILQPWKHFWLNNGDDDDEDNNNNNNTSLGYK